MPLKSFVNYETLSLPEVSDIDTLNQVIDKILVSYQGTSVIIKPIYPLVFLIKVLHSLRFTTNEIVIQTDEGINYSLFREYINPIYDYPIMNLDLLEIQLPKNGFSEKEQYIDCDSYSNNVDSAKKIINSLKKSNSIYLYGEKNKFLILVLSFFSYYFCKNLFYMKEQNSKVFKIY